MSSGLKYKLLDTIENGSVIIEERGSGPNDSIYNTYKQVTNGGLYGGDQSSSPWANIPIIPTELNLIKNNLKSANPPPNATFQLISTNRLGNNYVPLQDVYWYNKDKYSMHVLK